MNNITFHGGCVGCNKQQEEGIDYCVNCRYFEADWSKEDLSTHKLPKGKTSVDDLRNNIIERASILRHMEEV